MTGHPRDILLVGSVPLANADAVFRAVGKTLGKRIRRIPDGETGSRLNWVEWQADVFGSHPFFELSDPEGALADWRNTKAKGAWKARSWYRLKPGADEKKLEFGQIGYAETAKESFVTFSRCKSEGAVPLRTKFQVSLPTPYNVIDQRIHPADRLQVEPAYESCLLAEVRKICAAIPHDQLAIQWDVAHEVQNLDGARPHWFKNPEAEIVKRLVRVCGAVPDTVDLGIHLCYGDFGHRHFIEPKDMALMTRLSNQITQGATRAINWIHMPVPRSRTDAEYFAPLAQLRLKRETQLYVGLIHHSDGIAGACARMRSATRVISDFGIATECGFGRRAPETIMALLQLHAKLVDGVFDEREG
jgi:hypothetical protein